MGTALKNAVEGCTTCSGNPVVAAKEDVQTQQQAPQQEPTKAPEVTQQSEKTTVVMTGPLGHAMTSALNSVLAKTNDPQLAVGLESLGNVVARHVQANGMINDESEFLGAVRQAVGVIPMHHNEPTVINTMLDAVSRVRDIDFVFVGRGMSDGNDMRQDRVVHVMGVDGANPALEGLEVTGVQMIVQVRPKRA